MISPSAPALVISAVLLFGAGCGQEPTATNGRGVTERWYQPQVGYAFARPAVDGTVVLFGTGDGQVVARDRATGAVRWATTIAPGQGINGANLIARAGVVVAPVASATFGLDASTGRVLWRYEAPRDTVGGRTASGSVFLHTVDADSEVAYVPAWGASVSAVDLRTGAVRWVWTPGPSPTDTARSGVFRSGADGLRVSGDTVFASAWHFTDVKGLASEAWIVALDRTSGRELWRVTIPVPGGGVATAAQPALWGNLLIISTINGDQYAVDRHTRQVVWHTAPGAPDPGALQNANIISPTVAGDVVYHDGGNAYLYARRASDGTLLWRTKYDGQFTHDLAVTDRRIYGSIGGQLVIFDRQTGTRLHSLNQPHERDLTKTMIASGAAAADGEVYVTVNNAAWSFTEP